LLTVSRSFMNVVNRVLWRMAIILKANEVNLFVSSVLFVFWYHSPNFLNTPHTSQIQGHPINWIWWTVWVFTWITRSGARANVEMRFVWSTRVQLQGVGLPVAAFLRLDTAALLYHGYLLHSLQCAYPLHQRLGGLTGRFHGTGLQK
jgi:hypothetical protein